MRRGQEAKEESLVQAAIGFKVSELGAKLKRVPAHSFAKGLPDTKSDEVRESSRPCGVLSQLYKASACADKNVPGLLSIFKSTFTPREFPSFTKMVPRGQRTS